MSNDKPKPVSFATVAVGAVLILLGIGFLMVQLLNRVLDIDLGRFLWPFFIILPGLLLYAWGLGVRGGGGQGLIIAGSCVTMVGLLLLFQSITGLWATWAYAWALVAPTSFGLGLMLFGALKGQPDTLQTGTRLAAIGFALFFGFAIFFELIVGLSGFGLGRLGRIALPVLVIGAGVVILVISLLGGRRRE